MVNNTHSLPMLLPVRMSLPIRMPVYVSVISVLMSTSFMPLSMHRHSHCVFVPVPHVSQSVQVVIHHHTAINTSHTPTQSPLHTPPHHLLPSMCHAQTRPPSAPHLPKQCIHAMLTHHFMRIISTGRDHHIPGRHAASTYAIDDGMCKHGHAHVHEDATCTHALLMATAHACMHGCDDVGVCVNEHVDVVRCVGVRVDECVGMARVDVLDELLVGWQ